MTLKSSVLPEAASAIAPLIGPDTTVIVAMNGIPGGICTGPETTACRAPICRGSTPAAR